MKALVTGADGMLGQDLCPILEDNGYDVLETNKNKLDVTNEILVNRYIKQEMPDLIIHCAAYTNVDKAEEEEDLARLINSKGAENFAKAAGKYNSTLVYISTDYVFDGSKNVPYTKEDKPNPINVYGKTKYEGELVVKKYCPNSYIVRTSWLYGHHGKNFVETMLKNKDNPSLRVVDDQIGAPTWTVDLANGIVEVLELPFGIYHVCGKGKTSWYEFAREILGNIENLKPCTSEEFNSKANRPKYSVLEPEHFCRSWKAGLKEYLILRNFEE